MNLAETGHAWFTLAELAGMGLPGVPSTKQGLQARANAENWLAPEREGQTWRRRQGNGGGFEFTPYVLPLPARAKLAIAAHAMPEQGEGQKREREDLWRRYDSLPDAQKARAKRALEVIHAVETLVASGTRKTHAVMMVATHAKVGHTTINNWYRDLRGLNRCDWLPALAPRHKAFGTQAECAPEVWEMLKTDYLRLEKPNWTDCYDRAKDVAKANGWVIPSAKTLLRRIQNLPPELVTLEREGTEALKRLFPVQKRVRSIFHAMQAVNADGHKWDVFVRWQDGTIGRPVMVGFQDLYSGMILSWRVDKSENTETVRLAFGDMIEEWGIPQLCYLDNGRNFASKWLTGGTQNRYRWKHREEEPVGIMVQLGVEVHWTTPYSGQSKPIERAWRDLAQGAAKHPRFAGAYCGNNPTAKPENYGSKAVPIEEFIEVIGAEIARHNAKDGRRSDVCRGKMSFIQAFKESYEKSPITKATAEQARLWLMAAEAIRCDRKNGQIILEGNRFWHEDLLALRGQTCVVRFDPQALQADLHVYRTDGTYVCAAPCVQATGFSDKNAAQEHGRARRRWIRAAKEQVAAEKTLSLSDLAAMTTVPADEPSETIEAKVVRPYFPAASGNAALAVDYDEIEAQEQLEAEENGRLLQFLQRR